MPTLHQAIAHLYERAVVADAPTSTSRLASLADHCIDSLAACSLPSAQTEVCLPGGGREKAWDVAWLYDGKMRLAISLKSILRNLPGTVPNRLDDMMGEVANLQLYSPEVVIGYIMILDVGQDTVRRDGATWAQVVEERLARLSGRRPPAWTIGTVEATALVRVDFRQGPELLTDPVVMGVFFDQLAEQVRLRNPGLA